jgi:phage repressor protein C with HTH and peptisase S24 domain
MNESRLKIIRDDLGEISQAKLATQTGIPLHKIKDAESGKVKISTEIAKILEDNFNYSFRWVLTGEGPKMRETSRDHVIPAQANFPADDFVLIRQVNGRISAGSGLVPDDSVDVQAAFRKDFIKRKGGKPENMSLIKVAGDSMEPTLLAGDLVLVDHGRNAVAPQGGIYAIVLEDEILIKRVQLVFPDKILVLSDNRQYPTQELARDQVRVNGKVIWFARELER